MCTLRPLLLLAAAGALVVGCASRDQGDGPSSGNDFGGGGGTTRDGAVEGDCVPGPDQTAEYVDGVCVVSCEAGFAVCEAGCCPVAVLPPTPSALNQAAGELKYAVVSADAARGTVSAFHVALPGATFGYSRWENGAWNHLVFEDDVDFQHRYAASVVAEPWVLYMTDEYAPGGPMKRLLRLKRLVGGLWDTVDFQGTEDWLEFTAAETATGTILAVHVRDDANGGASLLATTGFETGTLSSQFIAGLTASGETGVPSLLITEDGAPHVVVRAGTDVLYATYAFGTWHVELFPCDVHGAVLVEDPNGEPAVIGEHKPNGAWWSDGMELCTRVNDTWQRESLDVVPSRFALGFLPDGRRALAYTEEDSFRVGSVPFVVTVGDGDEWTEVVRTETATPAFVGSFDDAARLHVVREQPTGPSTSQIEYARWEL